MKKEQEKNNLEQEKIKKIKREIKMQEIRKI